MSSPTAAARWADANAQYEEFSALGSDYEQAVDVNNHGVIVGNSKYRDGSSRGWVRYADGTVVIEFLRTFMVYKRGHVPATARTRVPEPKHS